MAEPTRDYRDLLLHNNGTMEDFHPHYMNGPVRVQEHWCLSFASGRWVVGPCEVPAFDLDGGGSWIARLITKSSTVPILLPLLLSQ